MTRKFSEYAASGEITRIKMSNGYTPVDGKDVEIKEVQDDEHSTMQSQISSNTSRITVSENDITTLQEERTRFLFGYTPGDQAERNDIAVDSPWTMIANVATTDRAAPQPQGVADWGYSGLDPTTSASAKQLIQGAIYTSQNGGFISGYRVYTITGNRYEVLALNSGGALRQVLLFEADATGWQEFTLTLTLVPIGQSFTLITITTEPAVTPTTWVGNWNYTTPNNENSPGLGVASHANRLLDSLRINKTDSDGSTEADRLPGEKLGDLTVGDIINGPGGIAWTIQAITEESNYFNFTVAPSQQGSPDGVFAFTFETVAATPITYLKDPDYWLGNPVAQGLEGIDTAFEDIVPDDNQYGVDIKIQPAYISPAWDFVARSG